MLLCFAVSATGGGQRMADRTMLPEGLDDLLAEICEALKLQESRNFELICDVEGLKQAVVTGNRHRYFDQERAKAVQAYGEESANRIRSLDAIIQQLRGT